MSNLPAEQGAYRFLVCSILLIGSLLIPQTLFARANEDGNGRSLSVPLIVKARPGDTPATIARRYLQDAAQAWMIEAYNRRSSIDPNVAVLIPATPFRLGGLRPEGFQTVPILAYTPGGRGTPAAATTFVATFKEQMQWLQRNAYSTITPSQLYEFFDFSGQLPSRAVLISVDTEALIFIDRMAPVIKQAGFTATVFVATGRIGEPGNMTWDDLKRLHHEGFTIGCRGKYGRSLARRKRGQSFEANVKWIEAELAQAKTTIEAHLGDPCLFLAYPEGGSNSLIAAMAARIGFSVAFTRAPGANPFFADRFRVHRTVVDEHTGLDQFAQSAATLIEADLQ